jgi:hypothetical protein
LKSLWLMMLGDPELEERQRRRVWHLETLHRALPFRMVCSTEAGLAVHMRKAKTARVRRRMLHIAATMLHGTCAVCATPILYPETAMPCEPLKICVDCARANVAAGDLLFWDSERPQKKARKRRQRVGDGR